MNRRSFIVAGTALAVPAAVASGSAAGGGERARLLDLIAHLEAWQGWEASSVVAAKAFAAWQIRKAMGMDLPNSKTAQMHIDYQRLSFDQYRESSGYSADEGASIAPMERALT